MFFDSTKLAWHNGRITEREKGAPSIASHSLHLGIGVFDGLMAYRNGEKYYLHEVDAHLDRFISGSQKMQLRFVWSKEDLMLGIKELLTKVPPKDYYIRPIAYRPSPQINVTGSSQMPVDVAIFGVEVARNVEKSLSCHISPYERVSSRAIPVSWKICGTYVNSYLVRLAAKEAGFDDGIMLDGEGRITEASAANIFFIDKDKIITPVITPDIFPGITRNVVIKIASSLGIKLTEKIMFPHEIQNYDGAFLAATLMELKPINKINDHLYDTSKLNIFHLINDKFQEITSQ